MRLLAIIDVQTGFINEWTRHIPDTVERLQNPFDRVFVTRFENPQGSPFRELKGLARFSPGAPDTKLAFVPRPDAVKIVKNTYSAYLPELREAARDAGGAIHLCGIATDNCVLATAIDFFEAGLRPIVISDACASHAGRQYHEAGLMILNRLIGGDQIVTRAALGL